MRALSPDLRRQLASAVLAARRAAEAAAGVSIAAYGVSADRRPEHLDPAQSQLRNGLRAKWRQLGRDEDLLAEVCAYEQWHRLLFARFLAENGLLLHPELEAPVTLDDCAELALELGEPDAWSVAARFAAEILPGIFRLDDPCVRLRFAPEGRDALERILDGLPREVFLADDALGWVYQYWQKDRKDEINRADIKIGGADLGPVTQLFTEDYMVQFLLENSLGAWWAAHRPDSPLVADFEYLRLDDGGDPATGRFDGWPDRVAEVTVMDPCCGSGHFLVTAFSMLWRMRAEEEELSPVAAQDAVLRDNLFGLELDARCVQIAMFAVVFQAWKTGGGWRQLSVPNVACSGLAIKASLDDWKALAGGDDQLEEPLVALHAMFREADVLGSLINPRRFAEWGAGPSGQLSFAGAEWRNLAPLVTKAASRELRDPASAVLGATTAGVARAAELLAERYTLIVTNVPYLGRAKQEPKLADHLNRWYPEARADLATSFLDRCAEFLDPGSSVAVVCQDTYLFLKTFAKLRRRFLAELQWQMVADLGPGAFREVSGEVVRATLVIQSAGRRQARPIAGINAARLGYDAKREGLRRGEIIWLDQAKQLANPDSRITFTEASAGGALGAYARSYQGLSPADTARFVRGHWELPKLAAGIERLQSRTAETGFYGGRSLLLIVDDDSVGRLHDVGTIRGEEAWGRCGVVVTKMGALPCTLFTGEKFDANTYALVPFDSSLVPALWAYCRSGEFAAEVRRLDRKPDVATAVLEQVPFDLERWKQAAVGAGPLPEPWSGDPTQWLFEGRPEVSTTPLQVAVGRLLGHRWPEQADSDELDRYADADGIVCLPAVAEERPAADRLQELLFAAFGTAWSPTKATQLLEQSGSRKKNITDWLRDDFFRQHCALFLNRPFVWHLWDGRKDGFSALVNYHQLDQGKLQKLTYTYLGQDWMERVQGEVRDEVPGAEARLAAAVELKRKLELILDGGPPYDIYVRWKDLHQQAIGWNPDVNDGVRLNIRPFVEAGVLRATPNLAWTKDRGRDADGADRLNDIHLTLAEKAAARKRGAT